MELQSVSLVDTSACEQAPKAVMIADIVDYAEYRKVYIAEIWKAVGADCKIVAPSQADFDQRLDDLEPMDFAQLVAVVNTAFVDRDRRSAEICSLAHFTKKRPLSESELKKLDEYSQGFHDWLAKIVQLTAA